MSKKKKHLIILSVVLAAIIAASVCCLIFLNNHKTNSVRFAEIIPDAVLGEEYDFEPYFEKEEDTTYVMNAEYMGEDFEWHVLEVDGFKFTQDVFADVHVTITATQGNHIYKGETNVGVVTTPDEMDQWMVNVWGGEGIKKSLNYDQTYFSVKDSRSSVKVDYMGTSVKGSAISVFPLTDWPNNERLTVTDWENAVLTFDVYNTSEKDMTFGFLIRHHELGINTNFGTNTQYVAKPNEWSRFAISLRSFGITKKPIFDADFDLSDYIVIQMTYDGATEDESAYVFGLYADNIDIVDYDAEKFPDLDTTLNYEYKDLFTNDDALSVYYDDKKIDKDIFTSTDVMSTESVKSVRALYSKNGSSVTGMVHSFIGGNPTGWKPLDISEAVLTFDVRCDNADNKFIARFESDYNVFSRDIEFDLSKKTGTGWISEALSDGWYRITLDVAKSEMASPFVRPDFVRCMRFYFTNASASKGKESVVYLDNLHMTGHEVTKYELDEENPWDTKSPYTAAEANDMFSIDDALSIYIGETKIENVMVNAADIYEYSKNSLLSFQVNLSKDGSPSTAMVHSFIGGNPTGWKPLDISKSVMTFDVKPSNVDREFVLKYEADYGSYSKELKIKAEDNTSGQGWKSESIGNGWYRITIDVAKANLDSESVHADFVRCMRLFFTNESAVQGKESVVYLDNLSMKNYKTTSHKLNASDPWNTPSPYGSGNSGSADNTVKELPACEKNDLINWTSEQCTMSSVAIDTKNYYGDSVQSLRLVQDKDNAEHIQWAAVFIAEMNNWKGVNITGNAICFDLKTENYANWLGVSIEHTEKGVSEGVYFTPTAGISGYGYECVELDSGWVRVYVYPDMLWSEYTDSVFKILFTLNKEGADISKDTAVNIDNLHLVSGDENNDAITAYSKCEDESLNVLMYDHEVHSKGSLRSLKLGISKGRGEVWGNADVYISELNDWKAIDLGGKTITMEVKPVNTASYFGMAVERSGQGLSDMIYIGFGSSDEAKGWACTALSNGWYQVQIDVDKAFAGYQDKVFKIRFLTTNSGMDDSLETALYIDKLYLDAELSELEEAVLSEDGDYIYADKVSVDGVLDAATEETSVTAPYSEKAMKMAINGGRGEVWGCADVVLTSLAEGKNITFAGKTITFDMKLDNALNSVGISLNVPSVGLAEWLWVSCEGSGEGWSSSAIGGGWYRFTLDMDTCFGNYASCVSELRYMISNSGQNQEVETAVYIDNLALGELTVSDIDESRDAIHTNLVNVNNMLDTFAYTSEKCGADSICSLKMGISAGRGETWSCGDILIAALNQWNAIDLSGKTIKFDIYAENMPTYFALYIGDSVNGYSDAIWVGLDSADNASGWKCESIGEGWYSVTVEVDKAFPSYKNKAYKLRFMVTNSGKDYSADMAMYVDNLDLGVALSELMGKAIASEEEDAIKTNAQNVDNMLSTLTLDTQVVSTDSTQSLKLGINGGRGEVWANADIFVSELIGWKPVDLGGKTISFDVKPVNNTPYFGFAIERSDVGLADMIYVGFNSYDTAKGWSCQEIGNGWYKAIIDLDKAFGGYQDRVFKLRVLISNSGQNQSAETAVYLDNLYLGVPISELTEGIRTEENDAINVDCQDGGNLNTIEYSTDYFSLYSERSLKLGINGGRGEVWASGDILIAALNEWNGMNLSGKIIEFDVKPVNSQNFFALATEQQGVGLADFIWIGFDSADEAAGWSCRPTGAGWYRVKVDIDKAFPNHATKVFKFRVMINNQNQNQSEATSVYIDNLYLN